INECTTSNPCHVRATCTNTQGSYFCTCNDGFSGDGKLLCDGELSLLFCLNQKYKRISGFTGNGFFCSDTNDIDECAQSPCAVGRATCQNTFGSFNCTCNTGYTGNGSVCANINECLTNPCDPNAQCADTVGSFLCTCNTGFFGSGFNCADINECLQAPCDQNAGCTNIPGSFVCSCKPGYSGSGLSCPVHCLYQVNTFVIYFECHDISRIIMNNLTYINECLTNPCHTDGTCSNTAGTFQCASYYNRNNLLDYIDEWSFRFDYELKSPTKRMGDGYDFFARTHINECVLLHSCHANATCTNTPGSFLCACNAGHTGDGRSSCIDINECLTNPCSPNGFSGNGFNCQNINECVVSSSCHTNADCTDTVGSFTCQCKSGYTGDGFACVDINECLTNPCHANAVCQNTPGSFTCVCNVGYFGNGFNCVDINECSTVTPCGSGCAFHINECTNPDICSENSQCLNNPGSYTCNCDIGYTGSPQCTRLPDTLSGQVRSNFDKKFSNIPQYRGANILRFSRGSVIFEAEMVFVPGSEDEITRVLDDISATGVLGNFSLVPGSLTTMDIPVFSDIQMGIQYGGNAGDMLEITCTVSGPSLPSFEWRNGSMILSLSTRVKIENNDQVSKLFVRNTAKSDSGDYHCIASKGIDTINSSVLVEVKVIPVVAVSPLSVSAIEGTTITLTCVVSVGNEEKIEYMWYNSKQSGIVGQARKLELSNFPLSDSTDTTVYWCLATNSDGTGQSKDVTVYIVSK
ncbi:fibrillin-2-like isoform X48, partial [Paramuricea clavata]